ncbi:hypothetical protein BOTBODRAFT_31650 [Botryobasidium botryosum FD-172 SS1]|uniref:Uncharacterized protein n=1 Tax=Botryobasidium botryosum (strain FD-172 SS1) TaxID=930990 RepID=A0A067MJN5_BOTB1|nr:hypothetical protein BOTBODRAFT_31650 [Botryobasidium botryosum FD-172 SS1]
MDIDTPSGHPQTKENMTDASSPDSIHGPGPIEALNTALEGEGLLCRDGLVDALATTMTLALVEQGTFGPTQPASAAEENAPNTDGPIQNHPPMPDLPAHHPLVLNHIPQPIFQLGAIAELEFGNFNNNEHRENHHLGAGPGLFFEQIARTCPVLSHIFLASAFMVALQALR